MELRKGDLVKVLSEQKENLLHVITGVDKEKVRGKCLKNLTNPPNSGWTWSDTDPEDIENLKSNKINAEKLTKLLLDVE